jgi:hypothetical protein
MYINYSSNNIVIYFTIVIFSIIFFAAVGAMLSSALLDFTAKSGNPTLAIFVWIGSVIIGGYIGYRLSHKRMKPKKKMKTQQIKIPKSNPSLKSLSVKDLIINNTVYIIYKNQKGEISHRNITITKITNNYIKAWCYNSSKEKTFNLKNILNLSDYTSVEKVVLVDDYKPQPINNDDLYVGNTVDILYKNKTKNITKSKAIIWSVGGDYINVQYAKSNSIITLKTANIINLNTNKDITKLSKQAQEPITPTFERHMSDKKANEFLGMLKGLIADGFIDKQKTKYIKNWIEDNKIQYFPVVDKIYNLIVSSNSYNSTFEKELLDLIIKTVGVKKQGTIVEQSIKSVLTEPLPKIIFNESKFIVSGTCKIKNPNTNKNYKRAEIEFAIQKLGGMTHKYPSNNTDYLVICSFSTNNWMHSNYGQKIKLALELNQDLANIKIIDDNYLFKVIHGNN